MTSHHDKAKRWQFGLRECLLVMMLVAIPIAVFRAGLNVMPGYRAVALVAISMGMAAGVGVGLACWSITGSRKWFIAGYSIVTLCCSAVSYFILATNTSPLNPSKPGPVNLPSNRTARDVGLPSELLDLSSLPPSQ